MNLPPHLLDQWLAKYAFSETPLPYNLASSTGPCLTVAEVLALGGGCDVGDVVLSYGPPQGHRKLREAIADFYGVDPDWVVVTTGASEALSILFCLASAPGAEIALPNLQFPAFDPLAGAWGLKARHYALEKEDGFSQDAEKVMSAVGTKCALAIVNTPHNPTGSVMARGEIETLARELKSRGAPLIVDEIYHPLYFSTHFASAATIDNVIVLGDMSKVFSLPGIRTGWLIDSDSERRKRIIDARSYFSISGSPLLEAISAHALRNRDHIIERLKVVTLENLGHLTEFMTRTSNTLGWVAPQGGTMAFPWFKDDRDARPFCEAAVKAGVLIAPGDCFRAPSHMRLGFGAQAKGYETALSILSEVLCDVS